MASDPVMKLLDQAQAQLLRQENGTVRAIVAAYEQARKELLAQLADAYAALGENPEPAAIRLLANQAGLVQAINARLEELQQEFAKVLGEQLAQVVNGAGENVLGELKLLADGAGMTFYSFVVDDLLELTIAPAVEQVPGITQGLASQLIATLRTGLAEGQRFRELSGRLYSPDPAQSSIFRRGQTSMELFVRRAVIQANNNSRLLHLEKARGQLPQLQKQAVAAIQAKTTKLCLRVHGQIQPLDKPFELKGSDPKPFARKMMQPPFHWNCRTSVVGYLPQFEETSAATTKAMVAAAENQLGAAEVAKNLNEDLANILEDVYDPFEGIRPPEGAAPRGQGQEYQDRRWIVNKIQTQMKFRSQLERTLGNYRGQQNQQWRMTQATNRVQELSKAIDTTLTVAANGGDWAFKREMIAGVFEYVSVLTRQP